MSELRTLLERGSAAMTIMAILVLSGCDQPGTEHTTQQVNLAPFATKAEPDEPDTLASLEARIDDYAILPMTPGGYPTYYEVLGPGRFKVANDLTRWAAIAGAEQRALCDRVTMIGVSQQTTQNDIVWYVDCANKQRLLIDEAEAEDAMLRFGQAV